MDNQTDLVTLLDNLLLLGFLTQIVVVFIVVLGGLAWLLAPKKETRKSANLDRSKHLLQDLRAAAQQWQARKK